jgi:hypothetical protein
MVTVTNGIVPTSASVTPAAGSFSFDAVYSGDANNNGATSSCEPLTVTGARSLTTTLSATTITVGSSVTDSATLSGTTANAGGTVTYNEFTGSTCTGTASVVSTVTVTNGVVPNSAAVTPTPAGSFSFDAVYSGDASNLPLTSACEPLTVQKASPAIKTTLSLTTITVGQSVTDSATLANFFQAGGSATYTVFSNGACTPPGNIASRVTVTNGVVPNSRAVTFNNTGSFSFQAVYGGDSNNNPTTSTCESLTVTSTEGTPVLLTFSAFNADDFDNGVGQLQVFVNGHLVVDIPAGLNNLSGTGDYTPYNLTWVKFGPFDISGFVFNGQNNVTFIDPLTSHFALVKNVTIVRGTQILLHVIRAAPVFPGHSVTYTFSIPPLVITSFTVTSSSPMVGQSVTFTATFTGGTTPFTCFFRFGDYESASVPAVGGRCSVTHDYDCSGQFSARVIVRGASTSDLVSARMTVTVSDD